MIQQGIDSGVLTIGGAFWSVAGEYRQGIVALTDAVLDVAPAMTFPRGPLRLAAGPNPFRSATTLRFSLASGAKVSLDVFDAAGRLVASPLHDALLAPGEHAVEMRRAGLANGLYFARVHAGAQSASTKLLVLQ